MSNNLQVDGIKLSLEMTLITIREISKEFDLNARFLKLMGENRINLPHLSIAARKDTSSGTHCILTEDTSRANSVIGKDEMLAAHLDYHPSVGSISVFPHNFSLQFLGTMMRLLGESGARLYSLATSISALSLITDYAGIDQTASYISRHVDMPENHSPFRPDMRIKAI